MDEAIVRILMKLLSLVYLGMKEINNELFINYVRLFFSQIFPDHTASLLFEEFLVMHQAETTDSSDRTISSVSLQIEKLAKKMTPELHKRQKILILVYLLQFEKNWSALNYYQNAFSKISHEISVYFNLSEHEYIDLRAFISEELFSLTNTESLLILSGNKRSREFSDRVVYFKGLQGQLFVFHNKDTNSYLVRYNGKSQLEMQGKSIYPEQVYFLEKGVYINLSDTQSIYYSDIVSAYIELSHKKQISFRIARIAYYHKQSTNGIHPFNLEMESGQMTGIMGGSGTGKSTLMNILNGFYTPQSGGIYINGQNLHHNRKYLQQYLGFIPQDDFLHEDLTVAQNIILSARLYLGNHSKTEISEKVNNLLVDLGLTRIKNLKVGSPLNKFISGGERKRLNIALELIREPYILLVDEPTSGLSSYDALKVIELLKEQTSAGKIVIINLHQPSPDIFYQLDTLLLLDKGGYPVYLGNPEETHSYFIKHANFIDLRRSAKGGQIDDPSGLFEILELKKIDPFGQYSVERKKKPEDWYKIFLDQQTNAEQSKKDKELPPPPSVVPGSLKQFFLFSLRNVLSKMANKQFLHLSLLVPPVLSIFLAYFCKNVHLDNTNQNFEYSFGQNGNFPVFVLMSVIVALFTGLIVSAGDINRDRKILARETLINLSKTGYLFSKTAFFFLLSFLQGILFTLIAHSILQIPDLFFKSVLVYFSISCFANMLGLVISSLFTSITAIYIMVPLIIIPQILFSGLVIQYENLNQRFRNPSATPILADLMASRWAYEAMVVEQFISNEYMKNMYEIQQRKSRYSYMLYAFLPEIEKRLQMATSDKTGQSTPAELKTNRKILNHEVPRLLKLHNLSSEFVPNKYALGFPLKETRENMAKLKQTYARKLSESIMKEDRLISKLLTDKGGKKEYIGFKNKHHNIKMNEVMVLQGHQRPLTIFKNKIVRTKSPVFHMPESRFGRAHFYAPAKKAGAYSLPTYGFNIFVIWLMSFILFAILVRIHKK